LSDEEVMSLSAAREVEESSTRLADYRDREFGVKQLLNDLAEAVETTNGSD